MENCLAEQCHDARFTVKLDAACAILLAVVIVATAFVSASWLLGKAHAKSNGSPIQSTTLLSNTSTTPLSLEEKNVLLIIDGCNGPIRLDRETFLQSQSPPKNSGSSTANQNSQPSSCISLLQVVNGENRGTRLSLLSTLEQFLANRPEWHVDIYFDGLGVDVHSQWGMAGKVWKWKQTMIRVKITPLRQEADHLIIQQIQTKNSTGSLFDHGQRQTLTLQEVLSSSFQDSCTLVSIQNQALVFQRNTSGPGRSRQILKRLGGLLRPESYYCVFDLGHGHATTTTSTATRDLRTLQSIRHLLVDTVYHYSTLSHTTMVATDDIFLRQRIVEAGGLVMTFEQLWDMLVPYSS